MAAAILLLLSGPLGAHTILIDTWESSAPAEMESEDRIRVVSAETGIMDTLFETGHLFFNMYSVPGDAGGAPDFSESLKIAVEIGADYILKLSPDGEGLGWELYDSIDSTVLENGYTSLSQVDAGLNSIERWTQVGSIVAQDLISAL